jgi:Concanavalin A-like lectin/glucanases superfamily/Secretion system C-terminal sorting domain
MRRILPLLFVFLIVPSAFAQWGDAISFNTLNTSWLLGNAITSVTDPVTIECWVKWAGATTDNQLIVYDGNSGSTGFGLYIDHSTTSGGNYLAILVGGVVFDTSSYTLPVGTWCHIAAVYNSSAWTLYVNGVSKTLQTTVGNPNAVLSGDGLYVGGHQSGGFYSEGFSGTIDEVRISNSARYTSNFTPPSSPFTKDGNTVALYHFNEGTGTSTADSSGNNNTLYFEGSPAWVTSDIPLAVQATDFIASSSQKSVTLTWSTASEINNAGFNILRADQLTAVSGSPVRNWHLIASYLSDSNLRGLGTRSTGRDYSFTDSKVTSGSSYAYKIQSVATDGATKDLSTLTVTVGLPKTFALDQNFPNPFNPTTTIGYELSANTFVTLKVYDVLGREVATLVNGQQNAGVYKVSLNASDYSSGTYFYRLVALGSNGQRFVSVKKLVLLK